MQRGWARLALRVGACALLGAVATVAVAWGCSTLLRRGPIGPASMFQKVTPESWLWKGAVPRHWPAKGNGQQQARRPGKHWFDLTGFGGSGPQPVRCAETRTRCGFPMLALESRVLTVWTAAGQTVVAEEGIRPPRALTAGKPASPDQLWGMSPQWPGFAINTAAYGAGLFLLVSAPGWLRRRMRTRRGLCTACGYDLRGGRGPCPECGT